MSVNTELVTRGVRFLYFSFDSIPIPISEIIGIEIEVSIILANTNNYVIPQNKNFKFVKRISVFTGTSQESPSL